LGCASGPNLVLINKVFPRVQLGGIDISAQAISTAKKYLPPASVMEVGPIDNMFYSNKSGDVILTDASLIYIGHDKINKVMSEIKRIGRNRVVLVEFHSTSFWKRLALKLASGYNAYDYKKLLEKHRFYDIEIKKLPDYWNGEPWKTFGHIITAKI
jgi:trans-aconitate methyltransferase